MFNLRLDPLRKNKNGKELEDFAIPSDIQKQDTEVLSEYEDRLRSHLIYHLTEEHCLPGKISEESLLNYEEARLYLSSLIEETDNEGRFDPLFYPLDALNGKFLNDYGVRLPLEMLFKTFLQMYKNEFSVLEALLPQGYIYTEEEPIYNEGPDQDPYWRWGGNFFDSSSLINLIKFYALKCLCHNFKNLKAFAFNQYSKSFMDELQNVLPGIKVIKKKELFERKSGFYLGNEPYALVLHNNFSVFKQNAESLEPVIVQGIVEPDFKGKLPQVHSDAGCVFNKDRPDLLSMVV